MRGPSEQDLIDTIMGDGVETSTDTNQQDQGGAQNQDQNNTQNNQQANEDANANADANTQQATQQSGSFDEELLKIGDGTLKTKDDIVALLERTKQVTEFETRAKAAEEKALSLEAKVNTDPFATPFLKGLNDLYKANAPESQIQAYTTLNKTKLEDLSPFEQSKLALQLKNGVTADEAADYLNNKYKLDPDEYDEATVKTSTIELKINSKADLEYLMSQRAESTVPPSEKQNQEDQVKLTALIEKLQPIAQNIINEIAFKGISINGKQGQDAITADFEISEDSKKEVKAIVEGYIGQNGANIPANEEGSKHLREIIENLYVQKNYKNWLINAASEREKQVRAEYNNPSSVSRGQNNPDTGKTNVDELAAFIMENANY